MVGHARQRRMEEEQLRILEREVEMRDVDAGVDGDDGRRGKGEGKRKEEGIAVEGGEKMEVDGS